MNGAAGVRRVRSSTGIGIAIVWIEFEGDFDVFRARQIVSEKLQLAQASLPPDVPRPVLAPVSSIMGEIEFIALGSDRHDAIALKTTADWVLRRRLLAVPGVAQVIPTGGETKQYQVLVNPERLVAYELGLNDVLEALRRTNQNSSAGFYVDGAQEYLIHAVGRVRTLDDIGATVVAMRAGQPVLVRQIADVKVGPALKRGEGSHDGKPAVILGIQKQPGANTLELTRRLDAGLDDIQATLPEGMTIARNVFRQADFIETAIGNLKAALRDGAILVLVIVAIFLASGRATAITVLAIPLSMAVAVLVLGATGATINTMTLGGMAIAVGDLVDDAIVDVENVVRRLRENSALAEHAQKPTREIVYEASREVRGSVVFATLVILLVFLPLFFLPGVEGRLLRPLGAAYVIALAASLAVALTVTPALAAVLLPKSRTIRAARESRLVRGLRAGYDRMLGLLLHRWRILGSFSLVVLALAGFAVSRAGRAFLPDFNEGTLTISVVTLPGTSLEESDRLGRRVEEILLAQPEVTSTARRTGRAKLDEHAQDVNAAEIDVGLSMKQGGRAKEQLLDALRHDFSLLPGTNVTIGQPISHRIDHMLSGTRANIAVKIFGDDLRELRRLGEEVKALMQDVPGVVDLSIEQQADIPILTMQIDREAIAQRGLRAGDVAEVIEASFAGQIVSRVRERQTAFDLLVRLERGAVADLDAIRATLVSTPSGARIPLHALADVRKDRGPNTIGREDVQRKLVVMCNVSGRDLGGVVDDIRARVGERVKMPRGYHVAYGGQFEAAADAARTLAFVGALSLCGVFALLVAGLGSMRDAALVLVNLPLALVGGVAGVFVSGGVLSIASMVGFITLFGIATRNGIMLVSHVHRLTEHEGVLDPVEAVRRGASERLAPILMTALAAGLALIPLALGGGKPGSEIQSPMAVVIVFGLLSSTTLNMLVLPALYLRFGTFGARHRTPGSGNPRVSP